MNLEAAGGKKFLPAASFKNITMYQIIPEKIPKEKRAEINEAILTSIQEGRDAIPPESIYNLYTGLGGLHKLKQSDYPNYHEYAAAKREFEMGQFFTPHTVCRDMVDVLSPDPSDMVLDMCCGMGNFFNFLPNLHNAYGFDIDPDAVRVASYLYPDAHVEVCDLQDYFPDQRFDAIIGNPPFNLRIDYQLSQAYYIDKAFKLLNPAGVLMMIVPGSFLSSDFWARTRIERLEEQFSFVGQTKLSDNAFASVGVKNFETKIMVFLRSSEHIDMQPYHAEEFLSLEELCKKVSQAKRMKSGLRLALMQETILLDTEELRYFDYKISKYLFELKTHKHLRKHYNKSLALVSKFRNQKRPECLTDAARKEWEQSKLTPNKVLGIVRRYITNQYVVPRKEVSLVKTSYGFKLKGYAPGLLRNVTHREASLNDLILERATLPLPAQPTEANLREAATARRLIARKRRRYEAQERTFTNMEPDTRLADYLNACTFINRDYEVCTFTDLQKHDLNLVLQKQYALLNWQQGSGKTAAVYHRAKYLLKRREVRNVFILAPAIATNMTWCPFLRINDEDYRFIESARDLEAVPAGLFLIVSTSLLNKLKRPLMGFVKRQSGKLCLVFDESDEITNPLSQRTRYALSIFRRLRYKILDTGTTTRNNIAELYSQFELLYNNSVNMICWSGTRYKEKKGEIEEYTNPYYGEPFPAYGGHMLFKSCHCPGKVSVFGIEKQNQDVYNKDALFDLIDKTIITRKFRDFAGEKYTIRMHTVTPSAGEYEVYRVITEEFCRICELYYNSTGDTRKDAGLRLMRQIKLLIRACSVPHLIEGYFGPSYPGKTDYIRNLVSTIPGKVAIGCTSIGAFDMYVRCMREAFPDRPLFTVRGDIDFNKRLKIVERFDATLDGVLVCTQQSLSSSINIPTCNDVILESLQWNIPKMEQFYFRFIRLDSKERKNVHYITYEDSIEQNLMALVLTKERLNEFIKSGEVKEQSAIFEEFDVTMSVIESLLIREKDHLGKMHVSWGRQRIAS